MANISSMLRFSKSTMTKLCLALAFLLAVAACFFVVHVLSDPYGCRIADGVTIAGLDVGGMTQGEARKALKQAAEDVLNGQSLVVNLPEASISLSPSDVHLQLDCRKAVKDAYAVGRGAAGDDSQTAAQDPQYQLGLLPYLTYDAAYIQETLEDYARQYDTVLTQPGCRAEGAMPDLSVRNHQEDVPCQTLLLTLGTPEAHLDVASALAQITGIYDQAFAAAAVGSYHVTVEVVPTAVPEEPDWDAIYEEFSIPAVDDTLDMQTFQPVPGSYGCRFDLDAAKKMAENAAWGDTVSIPMEYVEPEILGEAVYFRDVLGSCETKHNNNENRNTNLCLLCAALDGVVLEPGQEFSYNDTLGERTAEKGYKPAPAYSGNRLTDAIGGGVCQGSTTLYNCVLLADLEVVFRACHGAAVSYVPIGLDAAVNWGTTDFQFRNSSHFPIKITAEVSDGYVKMQILGTDEKDYYIEMTSGYDDSDDAVIYAVSYKNRYDKETGELISKDREAFSTYYRNIG